MVAGTAPLSCERSRQPGEALNHVRDVDTAYFAQAVLQRSHEVPVVVDFWAEWCGPCKVLGPLLEKAAADYGGAFELVKVDVDRNQSLSTDFRVQGIPTVVAFKGGQPVARFTGALPDRSVRAWLDGLLPTEADVKVDRARDAALSGDSPAAEALFRDVLTADADHQDAGTGLAALLIARGETDEALAVLGRLGRTSEVEKLEAAARVAASQGSDVADLERRLEEAPDNEATRIDLAQALAARAEFEPALDHLLKVVAAKGLLKERARLAMLDVFELLGNEHPLVQDYRRRLAEVLF